MARVALQEENYQNILCGKFSLHRTKQALCINVKVVQLGPHVGHLTVGTGTVSKSFTGFWDSSVVLSSLNT